MGVFPQRPPGGQFFCQKMLKIYPASNIMDNWICSNMLKMQRLDSICPWVSRILKAFLPNVCETCQRSFSVLQPSSNCPCLSPTQSDHSVKWGVDSWRLYPDWLLMPSAWLLTGTSGYHTQKKNKKLVCVIWVCYWPSEPRFAVMTWLDWEGWEMWWLESSKDLENPS